MQQSTTPTLYAQLLPFREKDQYLPEMDQDELISELFPASAPEMVQRLSDISAAMYGIILKHAGALTGMDKIDSLSKSTMYTLGQTNAARSLGKPGIERNMDGYFKLMLTTIFTANPEYSIEILQLEEKKLVMSITGVDRYHKIARTLGIEDQLRWPVILPYLHGISDEMGLDSQIDFDQIQLDEQSQCNYKITVAIK